jgi:signal transduction histidine kinase/HAMP domain-containing protein/ActR/RegA family two-component response regulator
MASNLTSQVRGIVRVVTAVANGDLSRKLSVDAKGEIAALAETINNMTDTLRVFAEQVTTVAREVGIEGKLGGQAKVPGASGTWRDLTDNVNQLAGNLTTQVRAISEVASAVTQGDLTRTIAVEAQGEVLELKDTINQMIANLRDTTHTNREQDWLKTNLAKFSGMMAGQRSLESLTRLIMSELTPLVGAQYGAFYVTEDGNGATTLKLMSSYAYTARKGVSNRFALGEGLVGQAALEKKTIIVSRVPEDYVQVSSGLGESPPRNIIVLPVIFEERIKGVIELASFDEFSAIHLTFLEQLMLSIGVVFNMIGASRRTEELLEELKRSNVELEKRTNELEEKATLLEVKNREIAEASANLEEKAKQLSLVSKYKSEFLANMSHELRTPLNSLLILAKLLAENADGNLTGKQVEYARTIHASGSDLLALIDQILDLSKIEAGKMQVERTRVSLSEVADYTKRSFAQVAREKGLEFEVEMSPATPRTVTTDLQRLQQILKNLLSNAFKFTHAGRVSLRIDRAPSGTTFKDGSLSHAPAVLAFSVTDTGIGIPEDKQQLIFEAFQQADASTSRTYGGTGLGLTITRELARLLGGEIAVKSRAGFGSTFTFYLPLPSEDLQERRSSPFDLGHRTSGSSDGPAQAAPLAPRERVTAPTDAKEVLTGKKVLLVDDDVRNLFAVMSLLERYGVSVVTAESAREGIDVLRQDPDVQVVLMDIMMPGMDGYEATRMIRSDERFAKLPIIALTAKAMPGDRDKCIEAGCTDFVPKPVVDDRLVASLASAVRGR